jgi:hypothetical protein
MGISSNTGPVNVTLLSFFESFNEMIISFLMLVMLGNSLSVPPVINTNKFARPHNREKTFVF